MSSDSAATTRYKKDAPKLKAKPQPEERLVELVGTVNQGGVYVGEHVVVDARVLENPDHYITRALRGGYVVFSEPDKQPMGGGS